MNHFLPLLLYPIQTTQSPCSAKLSSSPTTVTSEWRPSPTTYQSGTSSPSCSGPTREVTSWSNCLSTKPTGCKTRSHGASYKSKWRLALCEAAITLLCHVGGLRKRSTAAMHTFVAELCSHTPQTLSFFKIFYFRLSSFCFFRRNWAGTSLCFNVCETNQLWRLTVFCQQFA